MPLEMREIVASEWILDATALIYAHQAECESHLDAAPAMDVEQIQRMERAGMALTIGVFDEGKIVGYCMSVLHPHLHYRELTSTCNSIYISPAYRHGRHGLALMAAVEEAAVARGAKRFIWSAKPGSPLDKLLQAQGLSVEDHIYVRKAH
jgi:ribosomal protein S18 acetylase RimI-like enzyme